MKTHTLIAVLVLLLAGGSALAEGAASASSDRILAGDKLNIRVFGDEELTAVWHGSSVGYTVDALGNLNFPLLGKIEVMGSSIEELQNKLEKDLAAYLVYPKVNISFHDKEIGRKVSVLGQVAKPGSYDHRDGMTLVQLISEAGDFTRVPTGLGGTRYLADTSHVQVVRTGADGKRSFMVDVDAVLKGAVSDTVLEPGDLVVVSQGTSTSAVSVLGEVSKPGNYELAEGMTLVRLISDAQGFTRLADPGKVVITSGAGRSRTVDARAVLLGRAQDVELKSGDVIFVPETAF